MGVVCIRTFYNSGCVGERLHIERGEGMREEAKSSEVSVPISLDSDINKARQQGRGFAEDAGFRGTDSVVISAVISDLIRVVAQSLEPGRINMSIFRKEGRVGVCLAVHFRAAINSNTELLHMSSLLRAMEKMGDIEMLRKATERIVKMWKWSSNGKRPGT